jgi:ABC-type Zn uptake system ZnuABC Zn-binding protein ZnuA
MRLFSGIFAVIAALFIGVAAHWQSEPAGAAPLKVVVTVAPLKGLVEPLLPQGSTVTVLMQPGKSEHGYEFTPADVAALAKADLVVYVGLGLEGRIEGTLKKQGSTARPVVCFADAVGIKSTGELEHDEHNGAEHHEHGAGYVDPHLWLDPVLVGKLVPELRRAVGHAVEAKSRKIPSQEGATATAMEEKRLAQSEAALLERVSAVGKEWTDRLAPLRGRSVVTHHNAFSRPADRYGFKVAAVIREFETSEPSPGDIAKVVEAIRKEHVKTIFVEPQFSSAAADRIAERAGVKVGHLDPLGDGDWFKMMKGNLEALVSGLSDDDGGTNQGAPKDSKPATPGAK